MFRYKRLNLTRRGKNPLFCMTFFIFNFSEFIGHLLNICVGVLRLLETMQKDPGSVGPSTPTARLRRRRGSSEVGYNFLGQT